jgi:hypothetical protein
MDIGRLIAVIAVVGSGAYLRWSLIPVWIAYELGKLIERRRGARETPAR